MAKAKFAGKSCPVCGAEFIPGESDIAPHPTERGPKGGKVWVCEGHVNGAMENPRQIKRGKGKFKQTAQSVQAQLRHQNLLEDLAQEGGMGGYEYALAGRAPTRKYQQVENPFANAGRRLRGVLGGATGANTYKQGKKSGQPRLPQLPKAEHCDLSALSSKELVEQADEKALAELRRRGRDTDGMKMAWKKKVAGVRQAANNPFGF
jgi:hypothetical protein